MKKLICMLALLILAALCAAPALASQETTCAVTVETVDLSTDGTARVSIRISGNPGLIAMRLSVEYDAALLELCGAQNGDVFPEGAALFGNDLAQTPYTLLWEDSLSETDYTADGTLAVLTFRVTETHEAPISVSVIPDHSSTFNSGLQLVPFSVTSGQIIAADPAAHGAEPEGGGSDGTLPLVAALAAIPCAGLAAAIIYMRRKNTADAPPNGEDQLAAASHDHHFKWWFESAPIRGKY